jgi:hypothetical protein
MLRHRMEIAVVVEQWPAVLDAPGADQQVDRLPDSDAALAQETEIARTYPDDQSSQVGLMSISEFRRLFQNKLPLATGFTAVWSYVGCAVGAMIVPMIILLTKGRQF